MSWLQRLFSCSDRSELIAQLAGGRIEAVEAALLMGLFQSSKDTHIKSDLVSDQVPDDSGNLMGHGRNGLGSTQFGAQASVLVAQIAFIMMQRTGGHAQGLANPILAAAGTAVEHFAGAGFVIRTQTQPGTKMLGGLKSTQVVAELGQESNTGEHADGGDER